MGSVCSLGSINVDRVHRLTMTDLETLAQRYEWFPSGGRTISVDSIPQDFPTPKRIKHGGKGANQAVAAATAGADTTLFGAVGPDAEEFGVRPELERVGVDVGRVETAQTETGSAHVFVDPDGDNRIVVTAGANGAVDRQYVDRQYDHLAAADCLLLQNEIPVTPVEALLRRLAEESDPPTVILDPAPVAGVRRLLDSPVIEYLTPNEGEYRELRSGLDEFQGTVVRTMGADGATVIGEALSATPPPVDSVDTTGAGDVFNGVFAAELAAGAPLESAVETATVAGALSTESEGARGRVPTAAEVRAARSQ